MSKDDITEIFEFFKFSNEEQIGENRDAKYNQYCNFEQSLNQDDMPTVWAEGQYFFSINYLRDPQNEVFWPEQFGQHVGS